MDIFSLNSKSLIKKIKNKYPKIKIIEKERYFNYLPKSTELILNQKKLANIYHIDNCITFDGIYSNIYSLLILLILNEPSLIKFGLKLYNKLNNEQKYQGKCIGPLPEQIDKSKFSVLFRKK